MSTDVQVIQSVVPDALNAPAIIAQVHLIQDVMKTVMKPGEHYGIIPGCVKPSLLKPGAEKLNLTFRLDPQYESTERYVEDHLFVKSTCTLYHITSGRRMGSGQGSCSTKESKYAYRQGSRKCPKCGKESIIKGKEEYGGGWLCFKKKDGCGAKWPEGAKEIEEQLTGRIANEDVADQYNTILKMANKRSLIAAVLNVTAASDIFTQDMEDLPPPPEPPHREKAKTPTEIMDESERLDSVEQHTQQTPPRELSADEVFRAVSTPISLQEYMTKLKLSESVRELSEVRNAFEADESLSVPDRQCLRTTGNTRMKELQKK